METATSEGTIGSLTATVKNLRTELATVYEWIQQNFGNIPEDLALKLKSKKPDVRNTKQKPRTNTDSVIQCRDGLIHNSQIQDALWDHTYNYFLAPVSPHNSEPEDEPEWDTPTPLRSPEPEPDEPSNIPENEDQPAPAQISIVDLHTIIAIDSSSDDDTDETPTYKCSRCVARFSSLTELSIHSMRHCSVRLFPMGISKENLDLMFRYPRMFKIRQVNNNFHICKKILRVRTSAPAPASKKKPAPTQEADPAPNEPTPEAEPREQRMLTCVRCKLQLTSTDSLKQHMRLAHNLKMRALNRCGICLLAFSTEEQLKRHMKDPKLHAHIPVFIKCSQCEGEFRTGHHLSDHVRRVHPVPSSAPAPECTLCHQTFKYQHNLKHHLQKAHPDPNLARKCEICGRISKTIELLRGHMKRVHVEKNILCQVCGFAVKTPRALVTHTETMHTKSHIRKHKCTHCPSTFKNVWSLKRHVNRHLGKDLSQCPHCGVLKDGCDMYNHITIVHKGRKFKCNYCGTLFSLRAHLKNHFVLKHAEQPIPPNEDLEIVYTKDLENNDADDETSTRKRKSVTTATPRPKKSRMPKNERTSKLTCSTCDTVLPNSDELELHMMRHAKDPDYKLKHKLRVKRFTEEEFANLESVGTNE